jgi:hypothetical protein
MSKEGEIVSELLASSFPTIQSPAMESFEQSNRWCCSIRSRVKRSLCRSSGHTVIAGSKQHEVLEQFERLIDSGTVGDPARRVAEGAGVAKPPKRLT